ncbi:MAG: tetratricopeptide repeat protein [bacterium]
MATEQTTEERDIDPVPAEAPVAPEAAGLQELPEVQDFVRQHLTPVLVGVGLAVAIFLGWTAHKNYQESAAQTASIMLFNSQAAEQFQKVMNQYPNTPAGPLAVLSLGGKHFDDGQYELAQHVFLEFQQKYPGHDMMPLSEMGIAQCLEAMGRPQEAIEAFGKFLAAHPDHFLASAAMFGKARCLEQMGKLQESKAVYEDYLVANPSNNWSARAESGLLFVGKQMRAQKERVAAQQQQLPPLEVLPFTPVEPQLVVPLAVESAR